MKLLSECNKGAAWSKVHVAAYRIGLYDITAQLLEWLIGKNFPQRVE